MTRLVSGLALALAALGLVWFLPWNALLVVALVVAALAFTEFARLARGVEAPLPYPTALVATLAACAAVALPWIHVPTLLGTFLLAVAASLLSSGKHGAPLMHGAAAAMLAPVYIGLPLGALVGIHQIAGREAVIALVATVAASDTAQFYTGRAFGRRPLAPVISPKKTVEGAIGGLVLAPVALLALARVWFPGWPPVTVAALGASLAIAGICGDLFESALKRAAHVKDSSALIPGHGGVLDRIDALLFAAPFFYLFVRLT
jgi:phosphatidate cytidylyltransferase